MARVTVSRRLPYGAEQIFALVADVERYPEFLPWWVAARVVEREADVYATDQVIRFGPIRERFSSRTVLEPHRKIRVCATGGPWRRLELDWSFEALPDEGAEIRLGADVAFASPPLQALFERVLRRAIGRIIEAFERRARQVHGPAPPQPTPGRRTRIRPTM